MSVLFDSGIGFDSANCTYDGLILGGMMDLSALRITGRRVFLTDPDWPGKVAVVSYLSQGWDRHGGMLV